MAVNHPGVLVDSHPIPDCILASWMTNEGFSDTLLQ